MRRHRKFWVIFLIAAFIAIGGSWLAQNATVHETTGGQTLTALFDRQTLIQFFTDPNRSPIRGVGLFVIAHVIANAVGVPGTLLVIVGGAVYGLWWGTVWSVIGATLGAIAAFGLARYLLHDWFKQRFGQRPFFHKLNQAMYQNGLSCVLVIRFSPISPFNAVNFALGLTPVSLQYYAVGTLIGIIPGTLAYTWLGVTGAEALSSGRLAPLICCLIMLTLLSALPLFIQRYRSQ